MSDPIDATVEEFGFNFDELLRTYPLTVTRFDVRLNNLQTLAVSGTFTLRPRNVAARTLVMRAKQSMSFVATYTAERYHSACSTFSFLLSPSLGIPYTSVTELALSANTHFYALLAVFYLYGGGMDRARSLHGLQAY